MKRFVLFVVLAAMPVAALAEPAPEKTVALTQTEIVKLVAAQVAAARAQDAQSDAMPVLSKIHAAFSPPPAPAEGKPEPTTAAPAEPSK